MKDRIKSVKILNTVYSIKWVDIINPDEEDSFYWGTSDYLRKVITVALLNIDGKKFTEKELKETLMHEIIHAILNEGKYVDETNNEQLVEFLTRCLIPIVSDPKFKW